MLELPFTYDTPSQAPERGETLPVFYDCEICGHFHPITWNGDCRENSNRFSYDQLDAKYGANQYEIGDMSEVTGEETV